MVNAGVCRHVGHVGHQHWQVRSCLDWKRDEVRNEVKSNPIQNPEAAESASRWDPSTSTAPFREARADPGAPATPVECETPKGESKQAVSPCLGAESGGIYNQLEVGFQISSQQQHTCFGFTFHTLRLSGREASDMRRRLQPLPEAKLAADGLSQPNGEKMPVKFLRWLSFKTRRVRTRLLEYSKKEKPVAPGNMTRVFPAHFVALCLSSIPDGSSQAHLAPVPPT